jgi:DNA-binding PadR family transcriptional regulator
MRKASELEATVLGHVWKHGPCSPYSVRKHFLHSPTSRFSGSAGAIYPLVERLVRRGLLRSEATATGRREGWMLEVTAAGVAALQAWLTAQMTADDAGTYDPLRVKALFLGSLTEVQRSQWMDQADVALAEHQSRLEEHLAEYGGDTDPFFEIASWNAIAQAKVRREWIERMRKALEQRRRR